MTSPSESDNAAAEERAARRYMVMNGVRITSIAAVIVGIASAQGALPLPYALGVVLAVAGMVAFFFAPPLLARHWKKQDGNQGQ